jgi:CO dehydrogenase/acetyl-CoA synthase beta subunit
MEILDSLIKEVSKIIEPYSKTEYYFEKENSWEDVGHNQVILQKETLFELDGVGFNLLTSSAIDDSVVVVGKDLQVIKGNTKFARICFIEFEEQEEIQKTYNLIRKIEYTKYHFFPDGYMIRTSSKAHKENVRVSKTAVKKGIDFQKIGNLLINKFKENPAVKGVKVVFVTEDAVDFSVLESLSRKNHEITETLNQVMNNLAFDCDTCNLKAICDEVEGMRELHFKSSMVM